MLNTIVRRPIRGRVRELSLLRYEKKELIVWWYGGLIKNMKAQSVPKAIVFFRELEGYNLTGTFARVPVAMTSLGQLRIGSIWKEGICRSEMDLQTKKFHVDFTEEAWKFVSPWHERQSGNENPINQHDYPLQYAHDKNWLIDFPVGDNKNLLIPCFEFYSRCYGRSKEATRVLATYPWEEAKNRLFLPFDQPVLSGQWPVKLANRIYNGDVTLLAHILYDEYARRVAKNIYAQIEASFSSADKIAFIKTGTWFQGAAKIMVKGLWINGGQTFLGLQVVGCSDPGGVPLLRDRENTNKTDKKAEGDDIGKAWEGAPERVLKKLPEIVNLTGDDEPDHGSATVEVEDPDFIILGERRVVIDVRREQAKSTSGKRGDGEEPGAFSSGEPYGAGKGVGHARIHARQIMESHGALRDMWNAMQFLKKKHPELIQSIEWFTFDDGFRTDEEPCLIGLNPFNEESEVQIASDIRSWPYYDIASKVPRGVLLMRVVAGGKTVHFLEIQRRSIKKKTESGILNSEESFRGFAFVLNDQSQFDVWLHRLLSDIRHVKGVVQRLVGVCPGKAAVFNHTKARSGQVLCEAAVMNALEKIGLKS